MDGRVSSVQSLGAVDGPGLRYVVFLQGCPLRCAYCHNPETWAADGGEAQSVESLTAAILRYKPYFGDTGGVTVSGGEPLLQPEFTAALFERLHENGIHTALDTSGAGDLQKARTVLLHTDLVLCDLKFADEAAYQAHCGGSLSHTLRFLRLTQELGIPLWIRHVVAPGLTDTPSSIREIQRLANGFSNLQRLEWLPFKNVCTSKYESLGLPFPIGEKPAYSDAQVALLLRESAKPEE